MRGAARVGVGVTRPRALAASCLCAVALGGCGSQTGSAVTRQHAQRSAIELYLGEVEPIRLAVNRLLEGADPILDAFHDRRIGLTVLVRAADAPLPADLQQAGGGQLAPSPNGS
jgi:hypothetical protein